ncbi:hypothetical protein [Streptomyces sp. NPDC004629]|uniref:hypothetical protein n=1 Tax=Streptomyces sp. NPDC004629 TaxID=3364705 RepID=UPI00369DAF10
MRRTTIHRTTVAAATAAILLAGCGGGTGKDGGTAPTSPAPSSAASSSSPAPASSPAPSSTPATHTAPAPSSTPATHTAPAPPSGPDTARPPSPAPTPGRCTSTAELTAADNGRSLCLARGGVVRITLDGTADRPWKPLTASGDALKPVNPGFVILPGDAVAAYEAVTPGTAWLTSTRPLCPEAGPGKVSCLGIQNWSVAVRVS